MMNRLHNISNPYQNVKKHKRVLCVCSAGVLRSPTAAVVLAGDPYNYNTRAVGIVKNYALIPIDETLVSWADEIVVMEQDQKESVQAMLDFLGLSVPVVNLHIPDEYSYRDPELVTLIHTRYNEFS